MYAAFLTRARQSPLLTRFVVVIGLAAGCGAWLAYANLGGSLPERRMALAVPGSPVPVSIVRDEHGVPSIEAHSDEDAYFAVGYVQAQDRLWQLDMLRRTLRGELSEVLGKSALQQDIWFRTLDLEGAAQTAWPALSRGAQAALSRYTAGINAAIAAQARLPVEFKLLGAAPQAWTETDSLAVLKLFSLNLSRNFTLEMTRYVAGQVLTPAQRQTFFPGYPAAAPTTIGTDGGQLAPTPAERAGLSGFFDFQHKLGPALQFGGAAVGSNAWAVSGRLTSDGNAILANDPHLALQIPSPFYVIRVQAPSLQVAGMSLIGLPFVIFGRNANISWGGTNMMADTQDLYVERSDAQHGLRYEAGGAWQAFASRVETIRIHADRPAFLSRGYEPVKVLVRATRHGPVISDQYRVFEHPVALRWIALDPGDTSCEAFYRLQYATDWNDFTHALSVYVTPALNFLYADRLGNIGYVGAGRIPVRRKGQGMLPVPGWDDEFAWTGTVPAEDMPRVFNPASGFIVSANNKIIDDRYPHFISNDWAPPERAARITQLLARQIALGRPLTVDDMASIQADTLDVDVEQFLAELLPRFEPDGAEQAQALRALRGWRGDMAAGSREAAIFNMWMLHLRSALFSAPLRAYWNKGEQSFLAGALEERVTTATLREILVKQDSPWCGPDADPARPACAALLRSSLKAALSDLRKLTGSGDMASWRWDQLHAARYAHQPFSALEPAKRLFERRIASGGANNTVNVAGGSFAEKEGFTQEFGASFRQVISMGRSGVLHRYMNSTGQSGNPLSTHYADMLQPFARSAYYDLGDAAEAPPPARDARR